MWEGAYLSRTKESVFSWDCIVGFTDQLIKKKEYSPGIINRRTKKLPPQDSNQLTLFDVFDMGVQTFRGNAAVIPFPEVGGFTADH